MAVPQPMITISSSSPSAVDPQQGNPKPAAAASSSSSHRLPTQSAAEALQDIENGSVNAFISSGIPSLDHGLTGNSNLAKPGFERGKVAEIWGPPGGGKTSLAFQAASEAIKGGGAVVWIDCAKLLSASKIHLLDSSEILGSEDNPRIPSERFHYQSMSTLSHLLAHILHPLPTFPPPKTSLLVLDGLNTLLDHDFPRAGYSLSGNRTDSQKWHSNRRYSILGTLITSLNKLALLHNLAVLVTTGCNSKMRPGGGAAIGPGLGGSEWEAGTYSRIVIFRDFTGRYMGVQKVNGRNLLPLDPTSDVRNVIGFEIERDGGSLRERVVDLTSSSPVDGGDVSVVVKKSVLAMSQPTARKRVYEEIADSEDEVVDEYGWAEKDDEDVVLVEPVVAVVVEEDDVQEQPVEQQQQEEQVIGSGTLT